MSAVTMQISKDQIDLWTNITAWNPNERFLNNQAFSLLPRETTCLFYCFTEEEIAQLKDVKHVSFPFAYWKRGNTDCPSEASPFSLGWEIGKKPNVLGRLIVPIQQAPKGYYSTDYSYKEHSEVLKNIGYTLGEVRKRVAQLEGYRSRLFSTFIPLSCKGVVSSIKSLFPWTQFTYRYDCSTPLRFIVDLITLPFRLLAFVPRWLYQNLKSHPNPPFEARVLNGSEIDWNSGALSLYTAGYGTGNPLSMERKGGANPRDYIKCLGHGQLRTTYLG